VSRGPTLAGPGPATGALRRAADAALGILDPPGDLHATADYRKHAAGVLLRRAVAEAYGNATAPATDEARRGSDWLAN
jgi:carbon-monoxide dehydrogenase medium subunit